MVKKHNEWLLQGENENNEDYNRRISEFEAKERQKQATKIAELELIEQDIATKIKSLKNKDKSDFNKGVMIGLEWLSKDIELRRHQRQVIFRSPTEYELELQSDGSYKLAKR